MSSTPSPRFLVVAEGITDFVIIEALLGKICSGDPVVTMVQPERPAGGPLGEGWTGVRNWCQRCHSDFGGLATLLSQETYAPVSALIIHVDADVAVHKEIRCRKPCPPASDTVDALSGVILGWAGETAAPEKVVLCIPSKSIEAWVLAALYPDDPPVKRRLECRRDAASSLRQKPEKLISGNHKDPGAYQKVAPRVAAAWHRVHGPCPHAKKFHDEITALLP